MVKFERPNLNQLIKLPNMPFSLLAMWPINAYTRPAGLQPFVVLLLHWTEHRQRENAEQSRHGGLVIPEDKTERRLVSNVSEGGRCYKQRNYVERNFSVPYWKKKFVRYLMVCLICRSLVRAPLTFRGSVPSHRPHRPRAGPESTPSGAYAPPPPK